MRAKLRKQWKADPASASETHEADSRARDEVTLELASLTQPEWLELLSEVTAKEADDKQAAKERSDRRRQD